MATNRTFTMIKPDGVENGHIGGILNMITEGGFRIVAMKLTQLTIADAKAFYAVHAERPFYGELVEFMTRGPIVAAILEKDNAVEDFRTLIVLQTLHKLQKELSVKNMQHLLVKMQYMVQIAMKMRLSKVLSTLQEESSFNK